MAPDEAMDRLNLVLAQAWMVRTFLKHADEIQEDMDMLDVPRTLYDSIRAVEPAYQRRDAQEYLRRLKGKLSKFRKVTEYYNAHFRDFSPHTNFEMAGLALKGIVQQLDAIFAEVALTTPTPTASNPIPVESPSDSNSSADSAAE
ncbi:MAG: hypothetical protein U0798_01445 [Gemmataceae bacterium]